MPEKQLGMTELDPELPEVKFWSKKGLVFISLAFPLCIVNALKICMEYLGNSLKE